MVFTMVICSNFVVIDWIDSHRRRQLMILDGGPPEHIEIVLQNKAREVMVPMPNLVIGLRAYYGCWDFICTLTVSGIHIFIGHGSLE